MLITAYLIIAFVFGSIVSTGVKRITQAKRAGELPPEYPEAATWLFVFDVVRFVVLAWLAFLSWREAAGLYVILFVLEITLHPLEFLSKPLLSLLDPNIRAANKNRI